MCPVSTGTCKGMVCDAFDQLPASVQAGVTEHVSSCAKAQVRGWSMASAFVELPASRGWGLSLPSGRAIAVLLYRPTQDTHVFHDAGGLKTRCHDKRKQRNISVGGYHKPKLVLAALGKPCCPQDVMQKALPLYFPVCSQLAARSSYSSANVLQ